MTPPGSFTESKYGRVPELTLKVSTSFVDLRIVSIVSGTATMISIKTHLETASCAHQLAPKDVSEEVTATFVTQKVVLIVVVLAMVNAISVAPGSYLQLQGLVCRLVQVENTNTLIPPVLVVTRLVIGAMGPLEMNAPIVSVVMSLKTESAFLVKLQNMNQEEFVTLAALPVKLATDQTITTVTVALLIKY